MIENDRLSCLVCTAVEDIRNVIKNPGSSAGGGWGGGGWRGGWGAAPRCRVKTSSRAWPKF
jgi:hypothetical protein